MRYFPKLKFLDSFDHWLLKNRPLIWRTRIHYVLVYSLLVHAAIFAVYHLFPMTTGNMPSSDGVTYFRFAAFTAGCFGLLAWGFSSLKTPIRSSRFTSFLFTGLLYWIGVAAVCSCVWMASKALDQKVAALLEDQTLHVTQKLIKHERNYISTKLSPIEIIQLGKIYQVTPHFTKDLSESKIEKYASFEKNYGIPFNKFIRAIGDKISMIDEAKINRELLSVSYHYRDFYWLFLIGIAMLPMIALLLSMIELKTAIALGFGQFMAFIGIVITTINQSHLFEESYFTLTLFVFGLAIVMRFNHKVVHWLRLFAGTLIPVTALILMEEGLYYHSDFSLTGNLVLTLVTTVLVSFISYLYFRKINQPQSA